jgi:thiol-disulfide isomerase/thioredoxin
MTMLRRVSGPSLLGVLLLASGAARPQEAGAKGGATVVKYAGLADVVLENRGKVVLVDLWHVTCYPCFKGFPHLVEMRQKYARDGLVIVTVDPSFGLKKLPEIEQTVRKKLEQFNLTPLTNLILDEPPEVLSEKLRFRSTPTLFVFNRQGQWRQFDDASGGVDHKAVEELVVKLLAAK